jgi:excisionase family DNA binding protein
MLNTKQVAEKLGVSSTTIKRWTRDRKIPYCNVNGIIRFDEEKIDLWLERKTVRMKAIA